jgi:1,4-alpha-glucan branching enzyme
MEKDKRGYFRASIELEDGVYYYKFRVRKNEDQPAIEITDPYATELDLATRKGIARIKEGQRILDTYVWQNDDQPLPPNDRLVIYELLISAFSMKDPAAKTGGQYRDAIEKLDYLQDLGINAIELMPVNETENDFNWGYLPSYFFAPKPTYGPPEELKQFIDECHGRGIRVILDQLYNHSSEESPLKAIDRDYWYYSDRHHPDEPESDYWGPEFNYETYDEKLDIRPAWQFMGDVVKFWVEEYHIDGIRYDAVKQIANPELLEWLTKDALCCAGSKPFYNIGEHIPDTPDIIKPKGSMDACWHDSFYHAVSGHLYGEKFDLTELEQALNPVLHGYPEGVTAAIDYLCNHDKKRQMDEAGKRGILDDAAFKRAKIGAVLVMTAVGVPLIWMGEEFGEFRAVANDKPNPPIDWSLLQNERGRELFNHYKSLIALRKEHPALASPHLNFFHKNEDAKTFAYERKSDDSARVIVIINLGDSVFENYRIPDFPADGSWQDVFSDRTIKSSDRQLSIALDSFEAKVLVFNES